MRGGNAGSVLALAERPAGRWADLGVRVLSALILAPIAVACVWIGGVAFLLVVVALMAGLTLEWLQLCRQAGWLTTALPVPPAPSREARGGAVKTSVGLGYVVLAAAAILWLRDDPTAGRANVLILLLVVWSGDVGAYAVGRWIGGPRLAPRISPGKTWSGAIGGLLAAVAMGLMAAHLLTDVVTLHTAVVAAVLGIVAQAGDLLESLVKRRLDVKDSGHLIPGHGGLFDRLDGVLAAAPVAALLALTLGRGVVLWQ